MRIGFDYYLAATHAPGLGRYARELVRALVELPETPQLCLFQVGGARPSLPVESLGLAGASNLERLRLRLPRRLLRALRRCGGPGADRLLGGVDLFHRVQPHTPPVSRAPLVCPIAELPGRGAPQEATLARCLSEMTGVIVFSEHYRSELRARFDLAPERVWRVPVGCDHWSRSLAELPPKADPQEILVLGGLRRERHPTRVLQAFESLVGEGRSARLTYIGHAGSQALELERTLERSPARSRVRWIREPDEARLPTQVAEASLLVHLSEEEGTAVTPLEALSLGTRVVASRLPAFEEVLGAASAPEVQLLDHEDAGGPRPRTLADALERGLESGPTPAQIRSLQELAAPFTWRSQAAATLEVWEHALSNARC